MSAKSITQCFYCKKIEDKRDPQTECMPYGDVGRLICLKCTIDDPKKRAMVKENILKVERHYRG